METKEDCDHVWESTQDLMTCGYNVSCDKCGAIELRSSFQNPDGSEWSNDDWNRAGYVIKIDPVVDLRS